MKILTTLLFIAFSSFIYADIPKEIQGVWAPDIEKTIVLMKKNMPEMDVAFMREKYLPAIKRIITKNQYIQVSGKREIKADISLKEEKGKTFVIVLSNNTAQKIEITFSPRNDGGYIMQTQNPADGSANIVWIKQ